MKKLTQEQFQLRLNETSKARKIFIESGLTKNITHAFQLYQDMLIPDDEKMPVTIKQQPPSVFDDIKRPKCPECQEELYLNPNAVRIDGIVYPTTWTCKKCHAEFYTDKLVQEWIDELKTV